MIKYHLRMEENGETLWADLYDNYQQAYDSMENSFKCEKKKGYTIAKIDKNSAILFKKGTIDNYRSRLLIELLF